MRRLDPPAEPLLVVVDALDEAQDPLALSGANGTPPTIVTLLARHATYLPPWLKVVATSRRREDVLGALDQVFLSKEIDAEAGGNLQDLRQYTKQRCQGSPLKERLAAAQLTASEVAQFLCSKKQSSGKFLYIVLVLSALESEKLPLASRADLEALPPGLDAFYSETFQRRFPSNELYTPIKLLLGLLCVQQEPLGYAQLGAILDASIDQIGLWLAPLEDLLRIQSFPSEGLPSSPYDHWRVSFDHVSLQQWLTAYSPGRLPRPRADRFGVDRAAAAERIRAWALAEVAADRAHIWPYLVRHLASHLSAAERPEVIAGLLRQFPWLEARLRLAGLNTLLGDFEPSSDPPTSLPPELVRLGRALRQAAHVLSHQQDWNGQEQLASQLLARLGDNGALAGLREQATQWLHKAGGTTPLAASLVAQEALVRTLAVGSHVLSQVILPDGRLACGCADGTIRLWDVASGACQAVFEGHQNSVRALAVLDDGRLATGSDDKTIRIWDPNRPPDEACCAVFERHGGSVRALAVLGDGRLASGSDSLNHIIICLWDLRLPPQEACQTVFVGHFLDGVGALAVLGDGRLACGCPDGTIRIWDLQRPPEEACQAVFEGHRNWVRALAVLGDGRLASGSDDNTIRLWDLQRSPEEACQAVFEGHRRGVNALAVLSDGRLASGSRDYTIRLWDLQRSPEEACQAVFEGHRSGVNALAMLGDSRLASGSYDHTIRIWDLQCPPEKGCQAVFEGHLLGVNALAVLGDNRLASASADKTIRLWDLRRPPEEACQAVFEGHRRGVNALAVLGDGRLASGSFDNTIRIWDLQRPPEEACQAVFEGHRGWVIALAVLGDGRLISSSGDLRTRRACYDDTIRIWDPQCPPEKACQAVFEGHRRGVNALAVLGDGRLASGALDSTIRIWDLQRPPEEACQAIFKVHRGSVMTLAALGDGRFASGSDDNTIRFWDPQCPPEKACKAVFERHRRGVDPLASFEGHRRGVNALAVLGDDRLASGSGDKTIRLWDPTTPTGAPQLLFVADAAITALAWLPAHQLLVAGDASGRLHWLALPLSPR